jgi:hypothetical protein
MDKKNNLNHSQTYRLNVLHLIKEFFIVFNAKIIPLYVVKMIVYV